MSTISFERPTRHTCLLRQMAIRPESTLYATDIGDAVLFEEISEQYRFWRGNNLPLLAFWMVENGLAI